MARTKSPEESPGDEITVSSTDAQNRFGEVLRLVRGGTRVVVRRRGQREAVILPVHQYRDLERKARSPLADLEDRFASMLTRMREEGALDAIDRALASGPEALSFRVPPSPD